MRKFGVLWEWIWREPKHFLERALYEFSTTTYYYAILDSTKEISRNETARRWAYFLFKFKGTFRISLNVLNSCQCERILFCSCIAFKRISAILRNSISTFFSHMKSKSSWDACRWVKWVEGLITLAKITLESKTQNWFFYFYFYCHDINLLSKPLLLLLIRTNENPRVLFCVLMTIKNKLFWRTFLENLTLNFF